MSEDPPKPKHNHSLLSFPQGFLWGAATSAHQVEGGNTKNDWYEFEQNFDPEWRSGQAADEYNRFREDFDLAKSFNHNSHRLSIEWSRIEPEEGHFSEEAIAHYKEVLGSLKERDMVVMLTLWHFTLPIWLARKGGWENRKSAFYFERFVKRVVPDLKQYVDLWITINEPSIYAGMAYAWGQWPPNKRSYLAVLKVYLNLARAHKKAYKVIHAWADNPQVGIAHNVMTFENEHAHSLLQHFLVYVYDLLINHSFYFLSGKRNHDFLGINYYFHQRIGSFNGSKFPHLLSAATAKKDVSDLGWELYPEGMFDALKDYSDFGKPIYITENGLASTNDDRRCRFLTAYLKEIYHAIVSGIDVRGYFHWSLIDNFEWSDGFVPRFGLIEIDYLTQKRTPRPSSAVYANIIKHNGLPHYLLRFLGHTVTAAEVLAREIT